MIRGIAEVCSKMEISLVIKIMLQTVVPSILSDETFVTTNTLETKLLFIQLEQISLILMKESNGSLLVKNHVTDLLIHPFLIAVTKSENKEAHGRKQLKEFKITQAKISLEAIMRMFPEKDRFLITPLIYTVCFEQALAEQTSGISSALKEES